MPTVQARVPTTRAVRYLTQLVSHTGRLPHAAVSVAVVSDTAARISLDGAHCDVSADEAALVLTATADSAEQLQRIQDAVTSTLERIGRRDGLSVLWDPASV